jgi:hypothetical protein
MGIAGQARNDIDIEICQRLEKLLNAINSLGAMRTLLRTVVDQSTKDFCCGRAGVLAENSLAAGGGDEVSPLSKSLNFSADGAD